MPDKNAGNNPKSFETQILPRLQLDSHMTRKLQVRETILQVCEAMEEKGYNPVNQLTGYILSGDPTYITSYKDSRKIIARIERDELLDEFINFYLYESDQSRG